MGPLFRLGNGANVTLAHLVIVFRWLSLVIPLYNGIQWQRRLNKIRSNWKQKKDLRMTFLGRPGSVSDWEQKHVKKEDTGKAANKKGRRTCSMEICGPSSSKKTTRRTRRNRRSCSAPKS